MEPTCRICLGGDEPQELLVRVCKCTGTMKHIHIDCLRMCKKYSPLCRCCMHHYHLVCWTIDGKKRIIQFPYLQHQLVHLLYALCYITVFSCMSISMFSAAALFGHAIIFGHRGDARTILFYQCLFYIQGCFFSLIFLDICNQLPSHKFALVCLHVVWVSAIFVQLPLFQTIENPYLYIKFP
jgi:E3 ubiquitin-protein ligase DOA10